MSSFTSPPSSNPRYDGCRRSGVGQRQSESENDRKLAAKRVEESRKFEAALAQVQGAMADVQTSVQAHRNLSQTHELAEAEGEKSGAFAVRTGMR